MYLDAMSVFSIRPLLPMQSLVVRRNTWKRSDCRKRCRCWKYSMNSMEQEGSGTAVDSYDRAAIGKDLVPLARKACGHEYCFPRAQDSVIHWTWVIPRKSHTQGYSARWRTWLKSVYSRRPRSPENVHTEPVGLTLGLSWYPKSIESGNLDRWPS